jgi:hypothetical protein
MRNTVWLVEFPVVVVSTQLVIACWDALRSKLIGVVGGNECMLLQREHVDFGDLRSSSR